MFDSINGRTEGERRVLSFEEYAVWLERQGNNENTRRFNQLINQLIFIKHQPITSCGKPMFNDIVFSISQPLIPTWVI